MLKHLYYRYQGKNPFTDLAQPQPKFKNVMDLPAPELRCAIFFTPRSGSSYLSDIVQQTGKMGDAAEVFNPVLAHGIATAMGTHNIEDYVSAILRARSPAGVFCAEITWAHLLRMFGTPTRFMSLVRPQSFVWLMREDIVAQAVSIMAMRQTGVAHTKLSSSADIAKARESIQYNPKSIRRVIGRLVWSEARTEAFFERFELSPLRLTYETMTAEQKSVVLGQLAQLIGVELKNDVVADSDHFKLSAGKSALFAERFRSENPRFVARVERQRVKTLTLASQRSL